MSTELTKLASDAALAQLWQQRAEVHAQAGLPARMSPQWWQARGLHAVGQGGVPSNVFSQLSPGGGRVSVATHHSVGALDGRLQIDIYDAFSLERISSFLLDAPRRVVDGTDRTCARVLRWLDDAHLVLGFDDGWLRIYDGVGALCSEARIGAHVEAIARCAGKLAVGLFPGLPANAVAVGIKVFAMDALLAGRFEPEVFLPCDLRAGVPHTLRLDPDGSTIWLKGARTIHSDRSSTI